MRRMLTLLLLPLLAGCAALHPGGRVLSSPLIDGDRPRTTTGKVAMAPVTGTALLLDTVVVNPVRSLPKSVPQAHALTTNSLAFPHGALKTILPDPIALAIYLPFYAAGMAVSIPAEMVWHTTVPGALGDGPPRRDQPVLPTGPPPAMEWSRQHDR